MLRILRPGFFQSNKYSATIGNKSVSEIPDFDTALPYFKVDEEIGKNTVFIDIRSEKEIKGIIQIYK
jgi:hypothetical protein